MLNAITTKIEIDVLQSSDVDQALQYAAAHRLPAIVVAPNLVGMAYAGRIRRQTNCKIIVPVDWPKGEMVGTLKLRGMTSEAMQADGYEIMLTPNKTEAETNAEARVLTELIRSAISLNAEIRFVLGWHSRHEEAVLRSCRAFRNIPTPALLRSDIHNHMQVTKANARTHTSMIEKIRSETGIPIKVCGNIDSVRTIAGCIAAGANRLAVGLTQFESIVKDLQRQPDELRQLLERPRELVVADSR